MGIGTKAVTSKDVAEHLGLSQSTVSRAFSPESRLSSKTRQRILDAAQEMGYRPNAIARSLISAKTGLIGVVRGPYKNTMFAELLTHIVEQLQETDYQVVYYEVTPKLRFEDIIAKILQYRVDGIMLLNSTLSSEIIKSCQEMNIPVLQMLRYSANVQANVVIPDNKNGAMLAANHLLEQGYENFAYITGNMTSSSNMDRQYGFLSCLEEQGYNDPVILLGDYTYESGYRALREMANKLKLPCGILCANDQMALGVIDAARELGLRIPEDIGVIGFDDNYMSSWPPYQLTTLRSPLEEIAHCGVNTLIESIGNMDLTPQTFNFDFELIERHSTARKQCFHD